MVTGTCRKPALEFCNGGSEPHYNTNIVVFYSISLHINTLTYVQSLPLKSQIFQYLLLFLQDMSCTESLGTNLVTLTATEEYFIIFFYFPKYKNHCSFNPYIYHCYSRSASQAECSIGIMLVYTPFHVKTFTFLQ